MKRIAIALAAVLLAASAARAEGIGNSNCNAGPGTLSQDIYVAYLADTTRNGFSTSMTPTQQAMICSQVWAYVQFMTKLPLQVGPQTFTSAVAGNSSTATVTLNSGDATPQFLDFYNNLSAGSFNPLTGAGFNGLFFSNGTIGTGSLIIGPWSSSSYGEVMTAAGALTENWTSAIMNVALPGSGAIVPGFLASNAGMPATSGNDYSLGGAATYADVNANHIFLNTRAKNGATATGWGNVQLGLSYDVDATEGAAGQLWFGNAASASQASVMTPNPFYISSSSGLLLGSSGGTYNQTYYGHVWFDGSGTNIQNNTVSGGYIIVAGTNYGTDTLYLRPQGNSTTVQLAMNTGGTTLSGGATINGLVNLASGFEVAGAGSTASSHYVGTCTLSGTAPSQCTATVASTSNCNANAHGTTAASAVAIATSISGTTLTLTASASASGTVVGYDCW